MFYSSSLENLILTRHLQNSSDELLILSGWTGPSPIIKLSKLPIKTTVIRGIQTNISKDLASYITITNTTQTDIHIKNIYNHSKIYCWIKNNIPIDILVGSANCSTSGLSSTNGEVLYEAKKQDFQATYKYLKDALNDSVLCTNFTPSQVTYTSSTPSVTNISLDRVLSDNPPKVEICVGTGKNRKMALKSGWNWGHGKGNNAPDVAEQRIRLDLIKAIPNLFPNNGININHGLGQAYKNKKPNAEIIFDDGFIMDAIFTQSAKSQGQVFYKAFESYPRNNVYGRYVRKRLGLSPNALITDADIQRRGKDTITLELLSPGVYYCDFS